MLVLDRRINVAPMMDYTDRHCRFVHRLFSPHAVLYTEMVVAAAIVRGHAKSLLEFNEAEHPVALQLGGCDPDELAMAASIGASAGYDEINLNVGCPSDRVRDGAFGACLMKTPDRVAECIARMRDCIDIPVTVKCRIGIDDRDDYDFFHAFIDRVGRAGVKTFIVHARTAILKGLSPKQNREIPPLRYDYVHRLKRERCDLSLVLNGGLQSLQQVRGQLDAGVDGVMLGRAVCTRPALLAELEQGLIDPSWRVPDPEQIVDAVIRYAELPRNNSVRLHAIARHLQGLGASWPGARAWRRFLSEVAGRPGATPDVLAAGARLLRDCAAAA